QAAPDFTACIRPRPERSDALGRQPAEATRPLPAQGPDAADHDEPNRGIDVGAKGGDLAPMNRFQRAFWAAAIGSWRSSLRAASRRSPTSFQFHRFQT